MENNPLITPPKNSHADKTVLLLDFCGVGGEVEAIRQTLEYYGFDVVKVGIGRPNCFIRIL